MAELNELYDKLFPGKAVSRNFAGARVAQNVYVKYYVTIQFAASGACGGRGSVFAQWSTPLTGAAHARDALHALREPRQRCDRFFT